MFDPEIDLIDFFEKTPDLVCIASKEGFFRRVNPAVVKKLGYTKNQLFSRLISSFVHPDDREQTKQTRERMLSGHPLINFQNRYITRTGSIVWLEWTSIYFEDKELVFAIAKDITTRKEIENEIEGKYLKYKNLATHFKSSIEQERKYLAAELHEELAQVASIIKLDIEWMKTNITDLPEEGKNRIEHAYILSELLITTIQRISFSISPKMLEDLGLDAAMEWYCKEFSILTGINCRYTSSYNEEDLTDEVKLDFFRICQESLTNIRDCASALNIKIAIIDKGDNMLLTIDADGGGFNLEETQQKEGITHIKERVISINGEFLFESEPKSGTKICVSLVK